MKTLVVSGLGYEGALEAFEVRGRNLCDALRNAYFEVNKYYDEDEIEELKNETNPNDWDDEQYWLDEFDAIDSADFVLGAIYCVEDRTFIFNDSRI